MSLGGKRLTGPGAVPLGACEELRRAAIRMGQLRDWALWGMPTHPQPPRKELELCSPSSNKDLTCKGSPIPSSLPPPKSSSLDFESGTFWRGWGTVSGWGNWLSSSPCPAQLDGWIHEKMLMARDGTREDSHKLHKRWLRHQAFMAELAQNKEWLEKIERVRM